MTKPKISHLSDSPGEGFEPSERLTAVLKTLPKYNGVRIANALLNHRICTLADLCLKTPREMRKWKNFGKKSLTDLTTALAAFGLSLAESPSSSAPPPFPRKNPLPMVMVKMTSSGPVAVAGPVANIPPKITKPRISIIVERPNGHRSSAEISGEMVTTDMMASAEDLLHTLTTGERPVIVGLYDVCAKAFGTTREDAKLRLTGAMFGKESPAP